MLDFWRLNWNRGRGRDVYLLAVKILGPIALLLGLWWWHTSAVSTADKEGYKRALTEWQTADRIAVAVGAETTGLLKRNAAAQEGKFNDALKTLAARNAASSADARGLRDKLTAIASAPTRDPTPGPACRSYEREFRTCSGLLGEGIELAGEGPRLAGDIALKLTTLQDWAGLVQSVSK